MFNRCQRLAVIVESRRLQTEKRLIVSQLLRECAVQEDIPVVAGHTEDRRVASALLQRHDRSLLRCKRRCRTEELDHVALAPEQDVAQIGCQHTGRRVAPQLIALHPHLNVAAAQFREE